MIEFNNVTKNFGNVKALDNFTVTLKNGKITGLLGPNGSGKSTCIKMITGLNRPDMGNIQVNGIKPSKETKDKISYLPEIDYLYPWMTVKQTADFVSGFYGDWDSTKYKELIKFLELEPSFIVGKISRGMRAKVKLLFAFSRNAEIVLLDEPLSGIDVLVRDKIIQTIVKDYRAGEQTIVISTHEIPEIEPLIEHVVFMEKGKVKLEGDAEELRLSYGKSLVELMKEVY